MKISLIVISLLLACWSSLKDEPEHDCKERYYKEAYLKANTLLKYHDSINSSGLIINLSKYQPDYVKGKIAALESRNK